MVLMECGYRSGATRWACFGRRRARGTARFASLPHEGRGYRARESVLHVLAEQIEWFDRYVKLK